MPVAGRLHRARTFHNPANGFCVLRIKARGHRELVMVVGHAAEMSAGQVTVSGTWVNDREHGQLWEPAQGSTPSAIMNGWDSGGTDHSNQGDEFEIKLGRKQIKPLPAGAEEEDPTA